MSEAVKDKDKLSTSLCLLCHSSSSISLRAGMTLNERKLLLDFCKFTKEMSIRHPSSVPPEASKPSMELSLNKEDVPACRECLLLIELVMGSFGQVEEMEVRVLKMQVNLLRELKILKGYTDKLYNGMERFGGRMKGKRGELKKSNGVGDNGESCFRNEILLNDVQDLAALCSDIWTCMNRNKLKDSGSGRPSECGADRIEEDSTVTVKDEALSDVEEGDAVTPEGVNFSDSDVELFHSDPDDSNDSGSSEGTSTSEKEEGGDDDEDYCPSKTSVRKSTKRQSKKNPEKTLVSNSKKSKLDSSSSSPLPSSSSSSSSQPSKSKNKPGTSKDKIFSCSKCSKIFQTKNSLQLHEQAHLSHTQRETFQCPYCRIYILSKSHLSIHINKICPIGKFGGVFPCRKCDLKFDTRKDESQHRKETHSKYKCSVCGMCYFANYLLKRHFSNKHGVKTKKEYPRHPCPRCEKSFCDRKSLKKHVSNVHKIDLMTLEETPYKCSVCGRFSKSFDKHKKHEESCDKSCPSGGGAEEKEPGGGGDDDTAAEKETGGGRGGSSGGPPFICELCGKSYPNKNSLTVHIKYTCGIANYGSYSCKICGKGGYTTPNTVKIHERRHVQNGKERAYVCRTCGARFLMGHHLRRHESVCDGSKKPRTRYALMVQPIVNVSEEGQGLEKINEDPN